MSIAVGTMTALVTPFRGGKVDDAALVALVEAPTLEPEEHAHVVRLVVEAAKKRVPVIAGTGSSSTAHAIATSRAAQEAGADGLLVVTPYYNRPTQDGLVRHFKAICDAVPLPLIVYNIPGRAGVDMAVDTLARLCSEHPRVVGVKEATGSLQRTQEIVRRLGDRCPVLCGEDALNFASYAVGGKGCISVVSNVAPQLVAGVWDAFVAGDLQKARELHFRTLSLAEALFSETSPQPVKAALAMMGAIGPEIRPPLYPMAGPGKERLRAVLAEHGLV